MQFNTLQNVSKSVTQVLLDTETCSKYKYYEFDVVSGTEIFKKLCELLISAEHMHVRA